MSKHRERPVLEPGSPEAPTPFGPYWVVGLVARGGMAEVYRGVKVDDGRNNLVAIKVMRSSISKVPKYVDMFITEGKIGKLLEHPCIVRTIDVGRADSRYFISLEYISGKDLTHVLRTLQRQDQRLSIPAAIYISLAVARGLHHAHEVKDEDGRNMNIVNRDVSPSNIRVSFDGEVKLLDFGIAKTKAKFTSEIGTLKGKFSYMSPEQIRGLPLDRRTDIFSLGIVLHEMLTLERLFKGESDTILMNQVLSAPIVPPSKLNPRVPKELDDIVMKALARERDERYATAEEMAKDLEGLLGDYYFEAGELAQLMRHLFPEDFRTEMELKERVAAMQFASGDGDSVEVLEDMELDEEGMEIELEGMDDDEFMSSLQGEGLLDGDASNTSEVSKGSESGSSMLTIAYILVGMSVILFIVALVIVLSKYM